MSNQTTLRFITLISITTSIMAFQNCSRSLVMEINEGESVLSSVQAVETPPELLKTTFEPVLMDRYVLRSFLTDVFGPTAVAQPSFAVTTSAIEYGSPCSLYENYFTEVGGRVLQANGMESCGVTSSNFVAANTNPKASATRQAELPRLCSDLVTNEATFNFAMAKVSSSMVKAELSNENLFAAFQLFYREKPEPAQSLYDSLRLVGEPEKASNPLNWRSVLYTICASGHWQVL